jgi:ATP-dependent DNA helicase DinG
MYLPEGWTARPEQERLYNETVRLFEEQNKKVVMVDAPTGLGKSAIARALLEKYNTGLVVTASKHLQRQYSRDFPDMVELVGRGNFQCVLKRVSCDRGYYEKAPNKPPKKYCKACPYQQRVQEALGGRFYSANYSSALWTARKDEIRGIIIIDEGHKTENELLANLTVRIEQKAWEALDVDEPDSDDLEDLKEWVEDYADALEDRGWGHYEPAECDRMVSSIRNMLSTWNYLRWVGQASLESMYKNFVEFKPLKLNRYETMRLLGKGERALILSATILNPQEMARNLGLKDDEWAYLRSNKAFPARTRPVVFTDGAPPITRGTMEEGLDWLTSSIEQIMEEHDNDKGLVHTCSTKIAKHLKENLPDPDQRLLLAYGKGKDVAFRKHMVEKDSPTILVSPSMTEGVDLRGDLARFIIIAKCPFMSLGDKQVFERSKFDREWYTMHTVRQIIQACGRGSRSEDDYCITYILDKKVNDVLHEHEENVPEWFWDAYEVEGF